MHTPPDRCWTFPKVLRASSCPALKNEPGPLCSCCPSSENKSLRDGRREGEERVKAVQERGGTHAWMIQSKGTNMSHHKNLYHKYDLVPVARQCSLKALLMLGKTLSHPVVGLLRESLQVPNLRQRTRATCVPSFITYHLTSCEHPRRLEREPATLS